MIAALSNSLGRFGRDPSTGALRFLGCIQEVGENSAPREAACGAGRGLDGAKGVTVSPDGRNAYVAADTARAVGSSPCVPAGPRS